MTLKTWSHLLAVCLCGLVLVLTAQGRLVGAGPTDKKAPPREAPGDKDLAKAKADLASAKKALDDTKQALTKSQADLSALKKKLEAAENDAAKAKSELTAAKKALTEATTARDAARKDLAAEKERQEALVKKAREETEKILREARAQLDKSKADLAKARDDLRRADESVAKAHGDRSTPAALGGKARFIVELPENADLFISDVRTFPRGNKVVREFLTPSLKPGKRYAYNLRVEIVRDGKTLAATKRISFQPDTEQRVTFRGDSVAFKAADEEPPADKPGKKDKAPDKPKP